LHKEYEVLVGGSGRKRNDIKFNRKIVDKFWGDIPAHYPNIELEYFVIMPNHLHRIVILNDVVETGHAPSLRIKKQL
jgi:REP element-mobilizing transposase RayT